MGTRELAEVADRMSTSLNTSRREIRDYVKKNATEIRRTLNQSGRVSIPTSGGRFVLRKDRLPSHEEK